MLQKNLYREEKENKEKYLSSVGKNVSYYQEISFYHINSGTFLSVNPKNMAKEYGCIEVAL